MPIALYSLQTGICQLRRASLGGAILPQVVALEYDPCRAHAGYASFFFVNGRLPMPLFSVKARGCSHPEEKDSHYGLIGVLFLNGDEIKQKHSNKKVLYSQ